MKASRLAPKPLLAACLNGASAAPAYCDDNRIRIRENIGIDRRGAGALLFSLGRHFQSTWHALLTALYTVAYLQHLLPASVLSNFVDFEAASPRTAALLSAAVSSLSPVSCLSFLSRLLTLVPVN